MKLRAALAIYAVEGPYNGRDGEMSAKANASRVVHAFLTPEEIGRLAIAWRGGGPSRAKFLQTLQQVRERLTALGEL